MSEGVKNRVQELQKMGHDLLASKLEEATAAISQLLQTLETELSSKSEATNYNLLQDVSKDVSNKASDAKKKISVVANFLKENVSKLGNKIREQLVNLLSEADKSVDKINELASAKEAQILMEGEKLDQKILEAKDKLHQLLNELHDKYLTLRDMSKNWAAKFSVKRSQILNKIKGMMSKVRQQLTKYESASISRSKRDATDNWTSNYDYNDGVKEVMIKQMEELKIRIVQLEERIRDADGDAKIALQNKVHVLRQIVRRILDRISEPMFTIYGFSELNSEHVTNYDLSMDDLRNKVNEIINDLSAKASFLNECTKERILDISSQMRQNLENLLQNEHSKVTRDKRSLASVGKKVDDKIRKVNEALKFENLTKLTEEQIQKMRQTLKNAASLAKDVSNASLEAVIGHVEVARNMVDKILESVRRITSNNGDN